MIKLDNISFSYEDGGQREKALASVSLTIENGEFVCLLGPSGCGKTTLIRLLAGLHAPSSGTVAINGEEVKGPRDDTAIVFQDYALFPWMTARNNVEFCIKHTNKGLSAKEVEQRAEVFLTRVGMLDAAEKHPYQMSGGMRQRIAIARALAMDKDILLLDEPFGALDAKNRSDLQDLLEELWSADPDARKTVLFVTHDIREAVRLADRVIMMQPGKLAEDIKVDLKRPRTELKGEDADAFRLMCRELTEKMMDIDKPVGRGCRCGGPA